MTMAKWKGTVVAESDETVILDGNHYFPADSIRKEFFEASPTTSVCGWKGTANYYTLKIDGESNADAAWFYSDPKPEAGSIKGHVAFWKGVEVTE